MTEREGPALQIGGAAVQDSSEAQRGEEYGRDGGRPSTSWGKTHTNKPLWLLEK